MKILLVRAWNTGYRWRCSHAVGLASLAGYLRAMGHQPDIVDGTFEGFTRRQMRESLANVEADVVGITAMTHEIPRVAEMLQWVKERRPNARIVLGGPHATALARESLLDLPQLDFVVAGEGERPTAELLKRLSVTSTNFSGIPGLAWRGDKGPTLEAPAAIPIDAATLAQPAVDLYYKKGCFRTDSRLVYYLSASRGCPFKCIFCCRVLGSKVRWRTPTAILKEWITAVVEYGAKRVNVVDDIFFQPGPEFDQVIDGLIAAGIGRMATFSANIHVNLVRRETVRRARAAGCESMNIGIESGNDEMLRASGRTYSACKAEAAVRILEEEGVRAHCYFILGHPGETHRSIVDTIRFAVRVNPYEIGVGTMVPYPGTRVHQMAKAHEAGLRLQNHDWERYDRFGWSVLDHKGVRTWQLHSYQLVVYLAFYLGNLRFCDMFRYLIPRLRTIIGMCIPQRTHAGSAQ